MFLYETFSLETLKNLKYTQKQLQRIVLGFGSMFGSYIRRKWNQISTSSSTFFVLLFTEQQIISIKTRFTLTQQSWKYTLSLYLSQFSLFVSLCWDLTVRLCLYTYIYAYLFTKPNRFQLLTRFYSVRCCDFDVECKPNRKDPSKNARFKLSWMLALTIELERKIKTKTVCCAS